MKAVNGEHSVSQLQDAGSGAVNLRPLTVPISMDESRISNVPFHLSEDSTMTETTCRPLVNGYI